MSGILDNKSRVIDAIITQEGKRQMAEGTFSINYATFSDAHVVYLPDEKEGHVDPTNKIYLEAFNSPNDQIVFEADDSGRLMPFKQHTNIVESLQNVNQSYSFINGSLIKRVKTHSTSSNITSSFIEEPVYGSAFASQIQDILTSSFDNFNNLRIIGTIDKLFDNQDFALSSNEIEFKIPLTADTIQMILPTHVDTIDSLFNDEKLRNLINFKWLPPIKKSKNVDDNTSNSMLMFNKNNQLGYYQPLGPIYELSYNDIINEASNYQKKSINFDPTSSNNDLIAQFFEITNNEVRKLDVIDYGVLTTDVGLNALIPVSHHVFFIGKIVNDEQGTDCFIHLFTLIFGSSTGDE